MAITLVTTGRKQVFKVDGEEKVYQLVRGMTTIEPTTLDLDLLKSELQKGYDEQAVDATVDSVKQIREKNYDYVLCDSWVAATAESPVVITTGVILAIIALISTAITAAAVMYVVTLIASTIHNVTTAEIYCPLCGKGFSSLAELEAHKRAAHPEAPPYTCPHCGQQFATAEERDQHAAECLWKPPPVPGWVPWVFGGVAVTAVAVYVAPKVIERFR